MGQTLRNAVTSLNGVPNGPIQVTIEGNAINMRINIMYLQGVGH